jgi:hypothetical protein
MNSIKKEKIMSENPVPTNIEQKDTTKHSRPAWFGGVVLIIVGLAFIVQNLHLPFIKTGNWWAVFILIPIAAILFDIYHIYTTMPEGKTGAIASKLVALLVLGGIIDRCRRGNADRRPGQIGLIKKEKKYES